MRLFTRKGGSLRYHKLWHKTACFDVFIARLVFLNTIYVQVRYILILLQIRSFDQDIVRVTKENADGMTTTI